VFACKNALSQADAEGEAPAIGRNTASAAFNILKADILHARTHYLDNAFFTIN